MPVTFRLFFTNIYSEHNITFKLHPTQWKEDLQKCIVRDLGELTKRMLKSTKLIFIQCQEEALHAGIKHTHTNIYKTQTSIINAPHTQ